MLWYGNISHIIGFLWAKSTRCRGFLGDGIINAEIWCVFCWWPNKLLNKQSSYRWLEMSKHIMTCTWDPHSTCRPWLEPTYLLVPGVAGKHAGSLSPRIYRELLSQQPEMVLDCWRRPCLHPWHSRFVKNVCSMRNYVVAFSNICCNLQWSIMILWHNYLSTWI